MQIDNFKVDISFGHASKMYVTVSNATNDRLGRFTIEQTQHGTRVHIESGAAITMPHNRYTLTTDTVYGGGSATAGRSQCLRDLIKAAGFAGSQVAA